MPGSKKCGSTSSFASVYKRLTERGCRGLLGKLAPCEVADANEPEDSCLLARGFAACEVGYC
jgi:hypothetical protein